MYPEPFANISIRQLNIFLACARYENFSRAAEELFLTQSTVSRNIAFLEEEIGIVYDKNTDKASGRDFVRCATLKAFSLRFVMIDFLSCYTGFLSFRSQCSRTGMDLSNDKYT